MAGAKLQTRSEVVRELIREALRAHDVTRRSEGKSA
jgi:metal-responsive CopG/Arc/MetJ family transcriptional regulator